jgi:uncharacterized protein (TIGR03118 family)
MTACRKINKAFFNIHEKEGAHVLKLLLLVFVLSALSDPTWSDAQSPPPAYDAIGLISNSAVWTLNFDTSLVGPRGMTRAPDGPWQVADEGRGRVTPYNGAGVSFPGLTSPLSIFMADDPTRRYDYAAPVGIVYNDTKDFKLALDLPAEFLVATRDGTIEGWNSTTYADTAVLLVDNSASAAYTGIAIAHTRDGNRLYAANFHQNRIDVFDGDLSPLLLSAHAFTDAAIPAGFAPFNIQAINNLLYVTFAAEAFDSRHAAAGEGLGYVEVFDTEGEIVMRLEHGPWMNAPWGITRASERFGGYGGHLLVANAGSGRIAAFDQNSGLFTGFLLDRGGAPITISGLHGLGFGNDGPAGLSTTLYFTSGSGSSGPNFFGAIVPAITTRPELPPDAASGLVLPLFTDLSRD